MPVIRGIAAFTEIIEEVEEEEEPSGGGTTIIDGDGSVIITVTIKVPTNWAVAPIALEVQPQLNFGGGWIYSSTKIPIDVSGCAFTPGKTYSFREVVDIVSTTKTLTNASLVRFEGEPVVYFTFPAGTTVTAGSNSDGYNALTEEWVVSSTVDSDSIYLINDQGSTISDYVESSGGATPKLYFGANDTYVNHDLSEYFDNDEVVEFAAGRVGIYIGEWSSASS
jgi:hypothetical protein